MVKKSVGYVELEWTCPQCDSRNPGPQKKCSNCGAAQPEDVQFHQAAEEKLITDEDEIARVKAGPDVHCGFCGTRNPATAKRCKQCGADLESAAARESGRVVGVHRRGPAGEVKCPHCGAPNPGTALKCSQCGGTLRQAAPSVPAAPAERPAAKPKRKIGLAGILGIGLAGLVLVAICVLIIMSLIPSQELTGVVESVRWERSIQIEALQDVTLEDWRDEIPASATLGTCTERYHHTQENPAPGAREVCGTPYTVDTGTGHGEVVQDCAYEVYKDWCEYTAQAWQTVDVVVLSGEDLNPLWPDTALGPDQREGERQESFTIRFKTEEKTYTHTTSNEDSFRLYQIGSRWVLHTNALGGITSIEPER